MTEPKGKKSEAEKPLPISKTSIDKKYLCSQLATGIAWNLASKDNATVLRYLQKYIEEKCPFREPMLTFDEMKIMLKQWEAQDVYLASYEKGIVRLFNDIIYPTMLDLPKELETQLYGKESLKQLRGAE